MTLSPEMRELCETCETCRFWKRGEQTVFDDNGRPTEATRPAIWGDCRRWAPRGAVVIPEGPSGWSSGEVVPFPSTDHGDWCGEYQPARATLKEPANG